MGDVLVTSYLFAQKLEEVLQVVIKRFLEPVDHPLVVVLPDRVLNIFTLELYSLLSASNGVHKESVIVRCTFVVKLVLVHDVLVLSDEVVDVLLGFAVPFHISRAGEKSDDDSGEEVGS